MKHSNHSSNNRHKGKRPIKWCHTITELKHSGEAKGWNSGLNGTTYEETTFAGIEYVIDNLFNMENKINVAELLKDCPQGMELDCTMFNDVKFIDVEEVERYDKPICIKTGDIYRYLTKFGTYTFDENAKCVIFPKGKTTWEGFVPPCKFKDGDILSYQFKGFKNRTIYIYMYHNRMNTTYYVALGGDSDSFMINYEKGHALNSYNDTVRFATEEEKQKLFDAIKENGYKWNAETKTLEKLVVPKFKVGDRIRHKVTNKDDIYEISKVYDDSYGLVGFTWMLHMKYQDQYELAPNKFDINTLKPFDKVLVRDFNEEYWAINFFGFHNKETGRFHCLGNCGLYIGWDKCIPYKNNEHLRGTTNDCEDFYKTWK